MFYSLFKKLSSNYTPAGELVTLPDELAQQQLSEAQQQLSNTQQQLEQERQKRAALLARLQQPGIDLEDF